MKLLFDQNLSFKLCDQLADIFPGSSHVRLLRLDRAGDRELWEFARGQGFAIVSLDYDFADLSILLGPPPKVIWLRCGNQRTDSIARLLRMYAEAISEFGNGASACLEIS